MKMNGKLNQIADTIHGSIQTSEIEKALISTEAFNRLHNIYQNSTAYLTYPSNQTKRFAHSLGAMDFVGKIFYFGLLNADESVINDFLKDINSEICGLFHNPSFLKTLRESLTIYGCSIDFNTYCTNLNQNPEFFTKIFTDPLYKQQIPYVIPSMFKLEYLVAYQAVRCAALLHDLGHPPFSHITEFALKEVNQWINNTPVTDRQREFILSTKDYYEKSHELHEQIGNLMSDRLMESLERNNRGKSCPNKQIFLLLVQQFMSRILSDKEGIYQNIHEIISGPLDCDRMDYVVRDLENSGFIEQRLNFDRLINSMKLVEHSGRYLFCPNIRALGTIEDFFHQYWLLYKYVIYHHRVVKTDYLLGKAIVNLSKDFLANSTPDSNMSKEVLPDNISGLWKAIRQNWNDYEYYKDVLQWDDAWLLTILRREYFKRKTKDDPSDLSELRLMKQLEELISNKRNYCSVVKRMSDFRMIDHEVVKNFSFKWSQNKYTKVFGLLTSNLTQYNSRKHLYLDRVAANGFFLYSVKKIMKLMEMSNEFENTIITSIEEVASTKYNAKDTIVVFKNPKTGLEKDLFIHTDSEICPLKAVSRIPYDLASNAALFPVFFIYLHDCEKFSLQDFSADIGKTIAEKLINVLNKELT